MAHVNNTKFPSDISEWNSQDTNSSPWNNRRYWVFWNFTKRLLFVKSKFWLLKSLFKILLLKLATIRRYQIKKTVEGELILEFNIVLWRNQGETPNISRLEPPLNHSSDVTLSWWFSMPENAKKVNKLTGLTIIKSTVIESTV